MFVATDLSYRYPGSNQAVLSGLSLRADAGKAIALMGPSGSGKSTLLALLGGSLEPSAGSFAPPMESARVRRSRCSWIFQANYMIARRSALDNVALAASGRGVPWQRARMSAMEQLDQLGLAHRASAPVESLSGGEVQRVAIARAFAQERPVVLADEPTGQLDAANVQAIADALRDLARQGRLVVVATHDEAVALRLDEVVRLRDGQHVAAANDRD